MEELAACTVRAVELLVETLALLCLVVTRLICALLELMFSVRKRASIIVLASATQLPKLANLRLEFHLEALLSCLRWGRVSQHGILLFTTFFATFSRCLTSFCLHRLGSSNTLKELLGCGTLKVICEALVFPGLCLSLIAEVLILSLDLIASSVETHQILIMFSISAFLWPRNAAATHHCLRLRILEVFACMLP